MKILDWILGSEPVATATGLAGGVAALLGVLQAFDVLTLTPAQIAAVAALVTWLAGWAGRSVVSPVQSSAERQLSRVFDATRTDTVADDTRLPDDGGIPLAMIIAIVVVFLVLGGAFATCDALMEDEDEPGDLGWARIELVSHDYEGDPCWDYGDCGGGYDERNGGSGDGRGGDGRFGGGRSGDYAGGPGDDCRNACGNTIIVPSPGGGGRERR